ncbi:unnamed protein product [Ranitomeya imitator]|uniref:Uncharacterized protein n=1 Tax=Ranitomeya imitator TaxID=111125 RepID=A0ABN9MLP0_9NEOB|nr:unnamed protein product [Ranitomeya imitator]
MEERLQGISQCPVCARDYFVSLQLFAALSCGGSLQKFQISKENGFSEQGNANATNSVWAFIRLALRREASIGPLCHKGPTGINGEPEEQLLHDARNGNIDGVRTLLASCKKGHVTINLDCKGKSKSNMGWTPLHLACYFGHRDVVEELLKAGTDVNILNDMGDTPLHRAAFTGRKVKSMLCFCTSHHYDW